MKEKRWEKKEKHFEDSLCNIITTIHKELVYVFWSNIKDYQP